MGCVYIMGVPEHITLVFWSWADKGRLHKGKKGEKRDTER